MERLFDTVFETTLRLVVLLDELDADASADYISAIDFIALYGKPFSLSEESLNGDNPFMFCELASRRVLVQTALKECVCKGYALPTATEEGFLYRSTSEGSAFASRMGVPFADTYRSLVSSAAETTAGMTDEALWNDLNQKAKEAIERMPL